MPSEITIDEIRQVMPKKSRTTVTQDLVDRINIIANDDEIADHYRNNFMDHIRVMKEGAYDITEYMDAVRYVSYQLRGDTKYESWVKTFPERFKRLRDRGLSRDGVSAHVAGYGRSKLMNMILEQTLVPASVLNASVFQQAINVQADLMVHAKSEKVRSDAAANLIMHLKPSEEQRVNINIGVQRSDEIEDLRKVTRELAAQQKLAIENGHMNATEIAHSSIIIEAEIDEEDM